MENNSTYEERKLNQDMVEYDRINALNDVFVEAKNPRASVISQKVKSKLIDYTENKGTFGYYIPVYLESQLVMHDDVFKWNRCDLSKFESGELQFSEAFVKHVLKQPEGDKNDG